MNHYLPDDICADEVKEAAERFHARYRAVGKTYCYTCYVGATKPVFNRRYVTVLDFQPDVEAMQAAAKLLEGEHDFRSFCSNPRMKKSTVRLVDSIEIVRRKDYLYFNFHGTGFLQNMIKTAKVIEVNSKSDEIGLFDKVEIYIEDDDETQSIELVTTLRQNALKGLISKESPVGKAVLGRRAGDRVLVEVNPDYSYYIQIRRVEKGSDDASLPISAY